MKKRILGGVLALFLLLTLLPSLSLPLSAAEPEAFGTTRTTVESGKTYTISTQEELAHFSLLSDSPYFLDYSGVTILLTSDITITNDYDTTSAGNWTPIKHFYGTFDGVGHTVTIQCAYNVLEIGFISSNNGVVKNLTIAGSVSQHYRYSIGGITGTNFGTILNCRNTADIHDSVNGIIGGIAGINNGHIINCYNSGTISNPFICGGITGYCGSRSEIVNCYNTGTVTSEYCPGSISGILFYASITNCYYLLSSCSNVIGRSDYSIVTNIVGFDAAGTLMVEFCGTTDLLQVLNNWVFANQTASNDYFGWKAGSPYPMLTMEPVIMTETLDTAIQAGSYSVSLGTISISPVLWTLTAGTLPPGLALSSDGKITGTPTAGGIFNFTLSVQNGLGTASKALSIKVLSLQTPLSITGIPDTVTYGDVPFTIDISGGSGTGKLTLGISGETDLSGNPTTGVATINASGVVTILKPGRFQITAEKAGDDTYTNCSFIGSVITVNQKAVTVTGIGTADKDYDGSHHATITGANTAILNGILSGDDVTLDTSNAVAFFSDSITGVGKTVTFAGFALKGAGAESYTLTQPAPVKANIRQANPDFTLPGILSATQGQTLADITLPKNANGVLAFDAPLTTSVGNPGENNFTATFTPFDTLNYKPVTGIVLVIKVKATATSSSAASAPAATSKSSAVSTPETSSTASDVTAPQMGNPAANLPLLLFILILSAAAYVLLKLRKSRLTH